MIRVDEDVFEELLKLAYKQNSNQTEYIFSKIDKEDYDDDKEVTIDVTCGDRSDTFYFNTDYKGVDNKYLHLMFSLIKCAQ